MVNRSYRPIVEAAVDVVVMEIEAMVVAMYIYNKKDWKDKTCHGCVRKGHPKLA